MVDPGFVGVVGMEIRVRRHWNSCVCVGGGGGVESAGVDGAFKNAQLRQKEEEKGSIT